MLAKALTVILVVAGCGLAYAIEPVAGIFMSFVSLYFLLKPAVVLTDMATHQSKSLDHLDPFEVSLNPETLPFQILDDTFDKK